MAEPELLLPSPPCAVATGTPSPAAARLGAAQTGAERRSISEQGRGKGDRIAIADTLPNKRSRTAITAAAPRHRAPPWSSTQLPEPERLPSAASHLAGPSRRRSSPEWSRPPPPLPLGI